MFHKKQRDTSMPVEVENKIPVLKCSICTGEQVAGFKDIKTGKIEEVMLIRNERDLEKFKKTYNVATITKEY